MVKEESKQVAELDNTLLECCEAQRIGVKTESIELTEGICNGIEKGYGCGCRRRRELDDSGNMNVTSNNGRGLRGTNGNGAGVRCWVEQRTTRGRGVWKPCDDITTRRRISGDVIGRDDGCTRCRRRW